MSLEDVYSFDWVLGLALEVHGLHIGHGVHYQVGEEVTLSIQELRAHGSFGAVDQGVSSHFAGLDSQVVLDVLH